MNHIPPHTVRTRGFVDLYKVGRANYLPMTRTTNWEEYTHRMVSLLSQLGCRAYRRTCSASCRRDTTTRSGSPSTTEKFYDP